jgi:hemolysin activation/secretion protein
MKQFWQPIYKFTSLIVASTVVVVAGKPEAIQAQEQAKEGTFSYSSLPSVKDFDTPNSQLQPVTQIPLNIPRTTEPTVPEAEPLPPLDDLLENVPETPSPQAPTEDSEGNFTIDKFQLKGNTAFSDEEIQAQVLDKYQGKPISFSDLLKIETQITQLYTDNGYINSGAFVPPQETTEDTLIIQVVEGTIDDAQIKVNGRLSEEYIRSRLNRGVKAPFNINELQEALQLLQLNPLVKSINAELAVGASRNNWLLSVVVDQADAFEPSLFVNNSRTPSVGSFQRGIQLKHNNFAGGGEEIAFIYRNTDGSNDYDFDFTVPFNSLNGTLGLTYRYIDSDIIEPPFDALRINSQTDEYKLTIRQPIVLTATNNSTEELALGMEFARQANKTTFYDKTLQSQEPFPISRGADEEGDTKGETTVVALRFFQDWTRRTRSDVLAARSQFSVGLDALNSTTAVGRPDANFFAWRGQLQWVRLLDTESNTTILLRSDIQLSPDDLAALEQFSVGGTGSVRAYRQDSLLGDNGVILSGELRYPFWRWHDNRNSLAVVPFTDFGTVWSDKESANQEEDTVVSVGVGLQLDISDRLNARLDWGIPLVEVKDRDRTLQEDGIYFSVEYLPF